MNQMKLFCSNCLHNTSMYPLFTLVQLVVSDIWICQKVYVDFQKLQVYLSNAACREVVEGVEWGGARGRGSWRLNKLVWGERKGLHNIKVSIS